MVGNPRDKSSDLPKVVREGIEPEILRLPDWTRMLGRKDFGKPFEGIPLPGTRTPGAPPRLPSWFEDPSQPGLPPSLRYPSPGNDSPGFPPIPAPIPEPSTIPGSQIPQWLFDALLGSNRLDQWQLPQTSQPVLKTDASRNVVDSDMRLVAEQRADQGSQNLATRIGQNEEPSKQQKRFLISRAERR